MTHYTLDVLSSFGASVVKFTSLASSEAGFVTLLATEASSTAGSFKISSFAVVLSPLLDSSLTVTLRDSWSGSFNTPWRTSCRAICGGKKFVRYFRRVWSYRPAKDVWHDHIGEQKILMEALTLKLKATFHTIPMPWGCLTIINNQPTFFPFSDRGVRSVCRNYFTHLTVNFLNLLLKVPHSSFSAVIFNESKKSSICNFNL